MSTPVSFATDIKPLFREDPDVISMKETGQGHPPIDLWSFSDVSKYADDIYGRLSEGDMPCDGAWPQGQIDLFQQWMTDGKNP